MESAGNIITTSTVLVLLSGGIYCDDLIKVCSKKSSVWTNLWNVWPDCYFYLGAKVNWHEAMATCKSQVNVGERNDAMLITRDREDINKWVRGQLEISELVWVGANCTDSIVRPIRGTWSEKLGWLSICSECMSIDTRGSWDGEDCNKDTNKGICQSKKVCPKGSEPVDDLKCRICGRTSIKNAYDNEYCNACPANQKANSARTICINTCYSGKYRENKDDQNCLDCPRGQYKEGEGDECSECPKCTELANCSKQTTEKVGSKHIQDCYDAKCKVGNFLNVRTGSCKQCEHSGLSTRPEGKQVHEVKCESAGQNEEIDNNTREFRCVAGHYRDGKSCKPCPANTYKLHAGDKGCANCPDKQTTVKTGSTACVCKPGFGLTDDTCSPCDAHRVKTSAGNFTCSTCSGHQQYDENSKRCVCLSGYEWTSSGEKCRICGNGTYKNLPGNGNCTKCPESKPDTEWDGATSIDECTNLACPKGQELISKTHLCTNCSGDTAKMTADLQPCVAAGYGEVWKNITLIVCAKGFERKNSVCTQCGPNSIKLQEDTREQNFTCQTCHNHSYANEKRTLCIDECKEGNTRDMDGSCSPCKNHTYKDWIGDGACTNCDRATPFTDGEGKTNKTFCRCGEGVYYVVVEHEPQCLLCPANTYKNTSGDEKPCTPCPDQTPKTKENGAKKETDCVCDAGQTFNTSQGRCVPCEQNTYKINVGKHECDQCPAETPHTEKPGQVSPDACTNLFCPPGEEPDGEKCKKCPKGFGNSQRDKSTCREAEEGEGISAKRDHFYCLAGYFRNPNTKKCTVCPPGNFQDTEGNEPKCKNCSLNEDTAEKQRVKCFCIPGYEKIQGKCIKCGVGLYKETLGDNRCSLCEDGAPEPGSTSCNPETSYIPIIIGVCGAVVAVAIIVVLGIVFYMKHKGDTDSMMETVDRYSLSYVDFMTQNFSVRERLAAAITDMIYPSDDDDDYTDDEEFTDERGSMSFTDNDESSEFSGSDFSEDSSFSESDIWGKDMSSIYEDSAGVTKMKKSRKKREKKARAKSASVTDVEDVFENEGNAATSRSKRGKKGKAKSAGAPEVEEGFGDDWNEVDGTFPEEENGDGAVGVEDHNSDLTYGEED